MAKKPIVRPAKPPRAPVASSLRAPMAFKWGRSRTTAEPLLPKPDAGLDAAVQEAQRHLR